MISGTIYVLPEGSGYCMMNLLFDTLTWNGVDAVSFRGSKIDAVDDFVNDPEVSGCSMACLKIK